MPQNFTKALDTRNPEAAVNEKMYDTSIADMAKVLGGVAEAYGEQKAEEAKATTLGNFNADLADVEANVEGLRDMSDLSRIRALEARTAALNNTSPDDDDIAIEMFNSEMERINLREQQQGIVLDSNKRALIRKWTTVRPDLQKEFAQSLAINDIVAKMKSEGAAAGRKQFDPYEALRAASIANGTTVGLEQIYETNLRKAEQVAADYEVRKNRGNMVQTDFDAMAITGMQAEITGLMRDTFMPLINRAIGGNAVDTIYLKKATGVAGMQLEASLKAAQLRFEKENGVVISSDEALTYMRNSLERITSIITTSDAATLWNLKNSMEDAKLANAWAIFLPWLPPAIAKDIGPNLVVNAFKSMPEWLEILHDKKKGLPALAAGEFSGDPRSQSAMMYMRIMANQMAGAFNGSPLSKDSAAVEVMDAYFTRMTTGQKIPPELAVKAGPILSKLFAGASADSTLPFEMREKSKQGLIENTIASYDSIWAKGDILNPNYEGPRLMTTVPEDEYEKLMDGPATILRDKVNAINPEVSGSIQYNPLNNTTPFTVDTALVTSIASGRADTLTRANRPLLDAVNELNKMFAARSATRKGSYAAGHIWASGYYNDYLKQDQPVVEVGEIVEITKEDMDKSNGR